MSHDFNGRQNRPTKSLDVIVRSTSASVNYLKNKHCMKVSATSVCSVNLAVGSRLLPASFCTNLTLLRMTDARSVDIRPLRCAPSGCPAQQHQIKCPVSSVRTLRIVLIVDILYYTSRYVALRHVVNF